ncbi:outer membrane usher protein [Oxalobacteraceae bacterium GrIS 2.11]
MRTRNQLKPTMLIQQLALLTLGFAISLQTLAFAPAANENVASNSSLPSALYGGFNPAMLAGSGDKIDVSKFTRANVLAPGQYRVDVYINQQWLGRRDIEVKQINGSDSATVCITKTLLIQLGTNLAALPPTKENTELAKDESAGNTCVDMALQIPDSAVEFDSGDLRVDVSIPQVYLTRISRGYVDPSEWDQGVNAAFLSYNLNNTQSSGQFHSDQLFAGINLGVNLDGWRLRYNGTYTTNPGTTSITTSLTNANGIANSAAAQAQNASTVSSTIGSSAIISSANGFADSVQQSSRWQPINAFVQHDVTSLKSQLTIGDSYTNPDLFNSVGIQGVQLASDDRMLPESQRGYAPVVRGVAETNAKVTIRQGGNIIYETTVPPGEFKIDDLYNSSFAGDFVVTITETDGRQKQYVVPYSAGVLLLRPGATRYSLALGKLRNVVDYNAPVFAEATYQHGVGQGKTIYLGAIAGEYYGAGMVGAALSTGYGSFGLDLTRSETRMAPDYNTLLGRSWRLSYSKVLEDTKTNFSVAAYRYSTSDFLTLTDATILRSKEQSPGPAAPILSQKKSFQLSLSQPLPNSYGSVYISGIAQYYWNDAPNSISYQAGYSNSSSWGNYGFSVSRTIDALGIYHNLASVNVSIPIGNEGTVYRPTLTSTASYGEHQTTTTLGVNGSLGGSNRLNYNAYDNYSSANSQANSVSTNTVGLGGQYAGSYGSVWASYSSGTTRQSTVNVSGAMLLHDGQLLLAPSLGETVGIVYAPGAEGASVMNSNNNRIGSSGYSVIPFLNPYVTNDIVIDPKGSSMDLEFDSTSRQIAPRAGAIVLLKFSTTIGRAVLMTVTREDGKTLPIGSSVVDENGKELGLLAQGGRFFNRSLKNHGSLTIKWGDGAEHECHADYSLADEKQRQADQPYQQLAVSCRAMAQVATLK